MQALEEDKLDSPTRGSFSSAQCCVEIKHNGQLQGQKETYTFTMYHKNLHNFDNTYNKYHVSFRWIPIALQGCLATIGLSGQCG